MRVSNKSIPLEREEREGRSAEPYDRVHTGADTPVLILRKGEEGGVLRVQFPRGITPVNEPRVGETNTKLMTII